MRFVGVVGTVALTGWLVINQPAAGQWELHLEGNWRSQFDAKELRQIIETVEFSSAQQAIAEMLLVEHAEAVGLVVTEGQAFEKESQKALDTLTEAQSRGEKSAFEVGLARVEHKKQLSERADRIADLDTLFLENVELVVSADQAPLWEQYLRERRWRRLDALVLGVPMAGINLHKIIGAVDLTEPERSNPELMRLLQEYQTVMDGMLDQMFETMIRSARTSWRQSARLIKANEEMRKVMNEARPSLEESEVINRRRFVSDMREKRATLAPQVALRTTNLFYAELIVQELPVEKHDPFKRLMLKQGHEIVWIDDQTRTHHYAKRIARLPSLSEERRAGIDAVMNELDIKLNEVNSKAASINDEAFKDFWAQPLDHERIQAHAEAQKLLDGERHTAINAAAARLESLLTSEERSKVTRPPDAMAWGTVQPDPKAQAK